MMHMLNQERLSSGAEDRADLVTPGSGIDAAQPPEFRSGIQPAATNSRRRRVAIRRPEIPFVVGDPAFGSRHLNVGDPPAPTKAVNGADGLLHPTRLDDAGNLHHVVVTSMGPAFPGGVTDINETLVSTAFRRSSLPLRHSGVSGQAQVVDALLTDSLPNSQVEHQNVADSK